MAGVPKQWKPTHKIDLEIVKLTSGDIESRILATLRAAKLIPESLEYVALLVGAYNSDKRKFFR